MISTGCCSRFSATDPHTQDCRFGTPAGWLEHHLQDLLLASRASGYRTVGRRGFWRSRSHNSLISGTPGHGFRTGLSCCGARAGLCRVLAMASNILVTWLTTLEIQRLERVSLSSTCRYLTADSPESTSWRLSLCRAFRRVRRGCLTCADRANPKGD